MLRVFRWAGLIVLSSLAILLSFRFAYPQLILTLFGENMPTEWVFPYASLSLGQLYSRLGRPSGGMSVKDEQYWIRKHWWGTQELDVLIMDCCKVNEKPSSVYYCVYVYGAGKPVLIRPVL